MSNDFYNHTSWPGFGSAGTSASARSEMDRVQAGFDKMPTLTSNGGKFVIVNSGGTALDVSAAISLTANVLNFNASGISGTAVNAMFASPPAIGGVAAAAATFTSLTVTGVINGGAFSGVVSSTGGFQFPDGSIQTTAAPSTGPTAYDHLAILRYLNY